MTALDAARGCSDCGTDLGELNRDRSGALLCLRCYLKRPDPDEVAGTAEIKITGRQVCWEIKVARVQTIVAAHIHKGRPGTAGPVVVPFGKVFKAKGCTTTTAASAAAIQKTPAAYYVNVHNAKYPGGALRGQLRSDA